MYQETLAGKPERAQKIPAPKIQQPDTNEELMSQANRVVAQYTKAATSVRHPLGKAMPADHEAFQ